MAPPPRWQRQWPQRLLIGRNRSVVALILGCTCCRLADGRGNFSNSARHSSRPQPSGRSRGGVGSRLLHFLRGSAKRQVGRRLTGTSTLPASTSYRMLYQDYEGTGYRIECGTNEGDTSIACNTQEEAYAGYTFDVVDINVGQQHSTLFDSATATNPKLMVVDGDITEDNARNGKCSEKELYAASNTWSADHPGGAPMVETQLPWQLRAEALQFATGIATIRLCYSATGVFNEKDHADLVPGRIEVHGVYNDCTEIDCLKKHPVNCFLRHNAYNNFNGSFDAPTTCVRDISVNGGGFIGRPGKAIFTRFFGVRSDKYGQVFQVSPRKCGQDYPWDKICTFGGDNCGSGDIVITPDTNTGDPSKDNKVFRIPPALDILTDGTFVPKTVALCYCPPKTDANGCANIASFVQQIGVLHFYVAKGCDVGETAEGENGCLYKYYYKVAPRQRFAVRVNCPSDACSLNGSSRIKLVAQDPHTADVNHKQGDCQKRENGVSISGLHVLESKIDLSVTSGQDGGNRQDYKLWNWARDSQGIDITDEYQAGFMFPYVPSQIETVGETETFGICYCDDACDSWQNWFKVGQVDVDWWRKPCEFTDEVEFVHEDGPCEGGSNLIAHGGRCKTQCQFEPPRHSPRVGQEYLSCQNGVLVPETFECVGSPCPMPDSQEIPFSAIDGRTCKEGPFILHETNCTTYCRNGWEPETSVLQCEYGILTPPTFVCSGPCEAPTGIENVASTACSEGPVIQHKAYCTTNCAPGYKPDVSQINCAFGILTPSVFGCFGAPCLEPGNIPNAAALQCAEGLTMEHETQCTAQCAVGFAPSIKVLQCLYGQLNPPRFTCEGTPCQAPKGIVHAAQPSSCAEGSTLSHGDSCTAICEDGYVPTIPSLSCGFGLLSPSTFRCVDRFEQDSSGRQLIQAAMVADTSTLRALLLVRADAVTARGIGGSTALHVGALHGKGDIISLLLTAKAMVNAADRQGWAALHIAASRGHTEGVKELLKYGADARLKNDAGQTPRDIAIMIAGKAPALYGQPVPPQMSLEGLLAAAERRQFEAECISTGEKDACSISGDKTQRRRWRRRRWRSDAEPKASDEEFEDTLAAMNGSSVMSHTSATTNESNFTANDSDSEDFSTSSSAPNVTWETSYDDKACWDVPADWKDGRGYSCADYASRGYCTTSGEVGLNAFFDNFDATTDTRETGLKATEACCACGGGVRQDAETCSIGIAWSPLDMSEMSSTIEDSVQRCQARCKHLADCTQFSYASDGSCYLLDVPAVASLQNGVISGSPSCKVPRCPHSNGVVGYSFSHIGYWRNGGVDRGRVQRGRDCAYECDSYVGCMAFAWTVADGLCEVYPSFSNKVRGVGHERMSFEKCFQYSRASS